MFDILYTYMNKNEERILLEPSAFMLIEVHQLTSLRACSSLKHPSQKVNIILRARGNGIVG